MKIKYKLQADFGDFYLADVKDDDTGLCDAFILTTIALNPNGSREEIMIAVDGKTQEPLNIDEVFMSWLVMTARILERLPNEKDGRKEILNLVLDWHIEKISLFKSKRASKNHLTQSET